MKQETKNKIGEAFGDAIITTSAILSLLAGMGTIGIIGYFLGGLTALDYELTEKGIKIGVVLFLAAYFSIMMSFASLSELGERWKKAEKQRGKK